MDSIETVNARNFRRLAAQQSNFQLITGFVNREVKTLRTARISGLKHLASKERYYVSETRVAELFPDERPPRLIVAEDISETHEDLRQRNPSSASRISGELYQLKNLEQIRFFSMDCVILRDGVVRLPTQAQLSEVSEWLLDQEIIPVDSECRVVISK